MDIEETSGRETVQFNLRLMWLFELFKNPMQNPKHFLFPSDSLCSLISELNFFTSMYIPATKRTFLAIVTNRPMLSGSHDLKICFKV